MKGGCKQEDMAHFRQKTYFSEMQTQTEWILMKRSGFDDFGMEFLIPLNFDPWRSGKF